MTTDEPDRFTPHREDGGVALALHLRQYQATALAGDVLGGDDDMRLIPQLLSPGEVDPVALLVKPDFLGVELEALYPHIV